MSIEMVFVQESDFGGFLKVDETAKISLLNLNKGVPFGKAGILTFWY